MSTLIRAMIVIAALLGGVVELRAATPTEFYANLLRRGVAEFDAGRFDEAARYLRLAAFGSVDTIEQYQTAQVYLAVTYDRLGDPDRARDAAARILRAERVERRFARLNLPAAVRSQFDKIASRVLSASEIAALRSTEPLPPLRPQVATTRPTATQTQTPGPAVVVDRVEVEVTRPATPGTTTPGTPTQTTQPVRTPDAAATGTNGGTHTTPVVTPPQRGTTQPRTETPAATQPRTQTPVATQPTRTETQTPVATQPARPQTQTPAATTTTRPVTPTPARTTPPAATARTFTAAEISARFAAAERALASANLPEARRIFRELLGNTNLDHNTAVSLAEGFYRSRDFAGALAAFQRAGALRRGEEPYRYYIAVALYETGRYTEAKRELAAALPHIEITPDVARYRTRIESALE